MRVSVGNMTGSSRMAGTVIYGIGCGGDAGRRGGVRVLADFAFARIQPKEQAPGGSEQLPRLDFVSAPTTLSQAYCSVDSLAWVFSQPEPAHQHIFPGLCPIVAMVAGWTATTSTVQGAISEGGHRTERIEPMTWSAAFLVLHSIALAALTFMAHPHR